MNNIKRCFILIFALSLSFAPSAICWYLPTETELEPLSAFYYLFHDSPIKQIRRGSIIYSFDLKSIMKNEMFFMKIMGYFYVVIIVIFLAEILIQIIKKKSLDKMIKITSILFLFVTIIQFINAVLYRQMYEIRFSGRGETEWKCMWEINLVEIFIAAGLFISLYTKEKKRVKSSRQILFGHMFYSVLLLIALQVACFYFVQYRIENGDVLHFCNIFLEDTFFYSAINSVSDVYNEEKWIIFIPILLIAGILMIIMVMKKAIRESVAYILDIVLKIFTILFLCQIIYVCIFLNETWLIIPDIPMIVWLGWGSYRFLKASQRKLN